ncbi:LPS export ABC transporter periplasmic protein LptC [uncultured Porticoccus sp.]|uniref:LPS export ABC transporter periplasmic protein LptC n=1 Tax=uncultured Porticoccus sp. TaxID=1256050 RepID=UPI0030DD11E7|tara:strand:+ start:8041 stop:8622 length:582 start_codon:yes stop_codon:yes gene_type:complete
MRNILMTAMLLASTGIFLLFWLSPPEVFLNKPSADVEELPKADSYMNNIDTVNFDRDGNRAYTLTATEARHFNRGNRLELENPGMVSYSEPNEGSEQAPPWHVTSQKGTIYNGGERAVLSGDVYARQSVKKGGKNEFLTSKLTIFPETNIAETGLPVTIKTPQGETTGTGMWADLNDEIFKLLSKVKGIHRAP